MEFLVVMHLSTCTYNCLYFTEFCFSSVAIGFLLAVPSSYFSSVTS